MNPSPASPEPRGRAVAAPANAQGDSTVSNVRLRGYRLLLARAGWIAVAAVLLALDIVGTPSFFQQARVTCASNQCANNQITPAQLHSFLAAGLSVDVYATYIVVLYWIGILVYAAIAAVIFWRRSDDRMALLGAFALLAFGAGPVFGTLGALPQGNPLWSQAINLISLIGVTAFYVFFCLFPSGSFVPRWIRWVALLQAAGSVASAVPYVPLQALVGGSVWFFLPFGLLVFAQVYRYWRVSTLVQRQQTKWVVLGFAFGLGGFLAVLGVSNLVFSPESRTTVLSTLFFSTAQALLLCLIPSFIAIAILRSRLWDIDVLINKTLVYGSLTALLAAVYAGLIIGMEGVAGTIGGKASQEPFILVVSTLAIAALFQPMRRRLQRTIDRRFFRAKYDAARTLATFGAALRQDIDLAELREHLVAVVEETLQPTHTSLWLRPPTRREP